MTNSRLSYALLAPVAVVSLSGCGINSVPAAQETVKAKWADVQNQYQRRADLVPNLVAVVKGYARQEQDTLTQGNEARAKAKYVKVSSDSSEDRRVGNECVSTCRWSGSQNYSTERLCILYFITYMRRHTI